MGHRPRADGRIFQRRGRSRAAAPEPCSWSATSSRPSSASRAPIRASSTRCASEVRERAPRRWRTRIARCAFRDLSINASFRSAQAMLDSRRRADPAMSGSRPWACPRRPCGTSRIIRGGPGMVELWKPFTIDDGEGGEEGEEGWLDEDARRYADAIAEQVRAWLDEAPILDSTKRPLTPGRHPHPGPKPRRARLADRRAAVFGAGAGRRHRPAVPVEAVRGARPARRNLLRGAAARRPQPRQSAGVAADRLGPAAAVRPRLRARQDTLWRALRDRAGERETSRARTILGDCWRWPISPLRRASSRRSCRARSTGGASSTRGSATRRATRSRS